MLKKGDLAVKNCLQCGRPMQWRKKWVKNWEEVRYCSAACRQLKKGKATLSDQIDPTKPGAASA